MKICNKCNIDRKLEEFYIDRRNNKPLLICKKCHAIKSKEWDKRNWNRRLQIMKEGRWRSQGIDVNEANKVINSNKECKICGSNENLVLDHCHKTKRIRGVLCDGCNVGIGRLKDNPILCAKAAEYLS